MHERRRRSGCLRVDGHESVVEKRAGFVAFREI
jgi:hypothetical protein